MTEESTELVKAATAGEIMTDAALFDRAQKLAAIMAAGKCAIPKHLQGNVGDCFAVICQAAQWGLSPFVVAQKTHVVNGALGYEAQLINAVVTSMRVTRDRFRYEYCGDWEGYRKSGYAKSAEVGCGLNVGATLAGESELRWLPAPLYMENVKTRNSPLWATNPQQQIAYLAVKNWARLYAPDAILGVYYADELMDAEPINVTPTEAKTESAAAAKIKQAAAARLEKPAKLLSERIAADIAARNVPLTLEQVKAYFSKSGVADIDKADGWQPGWREAFDKNIAAAVDRVAENVNKEGGAK